MRSHDRRTHIARRILIGGVIGLLAAACSGGPAEPTGTITYWIGDDAAGQQFNTLTEELIPAFEAGHPWLDVQPMLIPREQLHDQLIAAIADGSEPDVVAVDITQVAELADMEALLPLDTEMSDFGALAASVYPTSLATNTWEGHTYGLPLETNTQLLIANRQILEFAGLGGVPVSMPEFEQSIAIYSRYTGGYAFASDGTDARNILPWIWAFGGALTDDSGTVASGYLNGQGSMLAVGKLNEWFHLGYLSPSMFGQGPTAIQQFGNGQAASMFGDAYLPAVLSRQFPGFRIDAAPLPGVASRGVRGQGTTLLGGKDIVVSKKTNAREAALAFVRFMLTERAQVAFATSGRMPAITSLTGRGEVPAHLARFMSELDVARAPVSSPNWTKIDEAIEDAVRSALQGRESIDGALTRAAATIDELLQH
jgi:multiple sugar transport system substrate-binding protein